MYEYKGYQIRKSGKEFYRIYLGNEPASFIRARSIEAAQALIISQGRAMTRKEHSLVYGSDPNRLPTKQQALSEAFVRQGILEGFI